MTSVSPFLILPVGTYAINPDWGSRSTSILSTSSGVSLRDLVLQTDNGSEFIGGHDRDGNRTRFPAALRDSQHVRIPPAGTPFKATSKPCIASKKMNSSTWKPSPAAAIS
jgi:hypothetical protein